MFWGGRRVLGGGGRTLENSLKRVVVKRKESGPFRSISLSMLPHTHRLSRSDSCSTIRRIQKRKMRKIREMRKKMLRMDYLILAEVW